MGPDTVSGTPKCPLKLSSLFLIHTYTFSFMRNNEDIQKDILGLTFLELHRNENKKKNMVKP